MSPRPLSLCLILLATLLSATAFGQGRKKIAVLEFVNLAELTGPEAQYVPDLVRGEATRLPQGGYLIMTRENILEMLPPGVDLASCEGACEVETGRNVGADYVVSGQIIRFGSQIKVSMKLYETGTGALLASERASAANVDALEPPVVAAAKRMLNSLSALDEPPVALGALKTPLPEAPAAVTPAPEPTPPPAPAQAVSEDKPKARETRGVIRLGLSSARLRFDDSDLDDQYDARTGAGIFGGVIMPLGEDGAALQLELGWIEKGAEASAVAETTNSASTFETQQTSFTADFLLTYIEAMAAFRYEFGDAGFQPYLLAGLFVGFLQTAEVELDGFDTVDIKDDLPELDSGIVLGGGLDLGALSLELRVDVGFVNLNQSEDLEGSFFSTAGLLSVGYVF